MDVLNSMLIFFLLINEKDFCVLKISKSQVKVSFKQMKRPRVFIVFLSCTQTKSTFQSLEKISVMARQSDRILTELSQCQTYIGYLLGNFWIYLHIAHHTLRRLQFCRTFFSGCIDENFSEGRSKQYVLCTKVNQLLHSLIDLILK